MEDHLTKQVLDIFLLLLWKEEVICWFGIFEGFFNSPKPVMEVCVLPIAGQCSREHGWKQTSNLAWENGAVQLVFTYAEGLFRNFIISCTVIDICGSIKWQYDSFLMVFFCYAHNPIGWILTAGLIRQIVTYLPD